MNMTKAMKAASSMAINPIFAAAFFHSTPILTMKKRTSWPERSGRRGPPRRYKNFYTGFTNPLVKQLVQRSAEEWSSGYVVLKCDQDKFDGYLNEIRSWCGEDFLRVHSGASGSCNSNNYSSSRSDTNGKTQDSSSSKSSKVATDMASERSALGLSATGPLNLEDVKTAYRACAVKWHPDHHLGFFSKAFAEEKFKKCNAAYESLCKKLASS